LYKRDMYLHKIKPFINKPLIKVITGIRRSGKSSFLKMLIEDLQSVPGTGIIYINKESLEYDYIKTYKDLYDFVKSTIDVNKKRYYLFIDEVQEIDEWEKAVVSFLSDDIADIYITGSNAHLLSSEIATLLSGRYVEFPVYTLGFDEFLMFKDNRKREQLEQEFAFYLRYGGFPGLHHMEMEDEMVFQYLNSLYNTILLKDIIKRNSIRNISLLENIVRFLFDNTGNIFSSKKVSDYIKSQKMKISVETVNNYIHYLVNTFSVYKVQRYDIKGKRILELYEKYYLGDIGLRNALLGYREADISGVLENIVFLELKRRGYAVHIGKVDEYEIDFIAEKQNDKLYIQVAYLLASEETITREFSVLQKVQDNYPKYVISMDDSFGSDYEGIKRMHIYDFLLNKTW
jgi:predicted AAA+ superfamily ATPase